MKVGILTFHDGPNHGAFLQAYALMKVLQEKGHHVYIINYKNKKHRLMESYLPILSFRRPISFIDFFKKRNAFKNAHKSFNLTPKTTDPTVVKKFHFDLAVIGSDVVWNYKIFGLDDLFFGDLNADKIISYATSFGWVSYDEKFPPQLSNKLKRFDSISVRDINSNKIVKEVINLNPPIVLDPTLIYDFDYDEKNYKLPKSFSNYILVYSYISNDKMIKKVKGIANKRGLKIIAVGYRQFWCDKVFMDVGPFEWLNLFRKASLIVTSTFHGTVFSIKYGKPFYFITNEKAKNRVQYLLDLCGIKRNLGIEEGEIIKVSPAYNSVKERLGAEIKKSQKWLISNI